MARSGKGKEEGRLIAVEGAATGAQFLEEAKSLLRHLGTKKSEGGVSPWDASGTFFGLSMTGRKLPKPSARTLLLLYASDLLFRLRWEIEPALKLGQVVVAAPYVQSAIAIGTAAGLPRRWLNELFSFAPKPDVCFRLKTRKKESPFKQKSLDGFLEYVCTTLSEAAAAGAGVRRDEKEIRHRFTGCLDEFEDEGLSVPLSKRAVARLRKDN